MSQTAPQQLRAFIERILRLKEEQDTLAADIRDIYAEAKGSGFDKTALGEVVSHLRKVEKKGKDAMDERSALFDMYLSAFEGRASHAHARESSEIEGEQTHLDRGTPAAPSMQGGQTNSHSSLLSSSAAETKAEAAPILPSASATPIKSEAA